jgi:hypothetical protein
MLSLRALGMQRCAVALAVLGAVAAARAEPPTAQFAGAQLLMAQTALEGARAALEQHDYAMARRFAAQASLDARLAWRMTDSEAARHDAVELSRQAETLRWRSVVGSGSTAASSASP